MRRKPATATPRALVVYYETEMYGPTKTIVLCDAHRDRFFSFHPNARGAGEWKPAAECEQCRRIVAMISSSNASV
jgi:hypothetical protein